MPQVLVLALLFHVLFATKLSLVEHGPKNAKMMEATVSEPYLEVADPANNIKGNQSGVKVPTGKVSRRCKAALEQIEDTLGRVTDQLGELGLYTDVMIHLGAIKFAFSFLGVKKDGMPATNFLVGEHLLCQKGHHMCNHEDVVDEAVRLIGDGGGDVLAYDLARAGEAMLSSCGREAEGTRYNGLWKSLTVMVMRSLDFVLCAQFGRNLTLIRDSVNTITPIATKLGVPPEFFQVERNGSADCSEDDPELVLAEVSNSADLELELNQAVRHVMKEPHRRDFLEAMAPGLVDVLEKNPLALTQLQQDPSGRATAYAVNSAIPNGQHSLNKAKHPFAHGSPVWMHAKMREWYANNPHLGKEEEFLLQETCKKDPWKKDTTFRRRSNKNAGRRRRREKHPPKRPEVDPRGLDLGWEEQMTGAISSSISPSMSQVTYGSLSGSPSFSFGFGFNQINASSSASFIASRHCEQWDVFEDLFGRADGCSSPTPLLFKAVVTPPCWSHDLCWQCRGVTASCDSSFFHAIQRRCHQRVRWFTGERSICYHQANAIWAAVRGWSSFQEQVERPSWCDDTIAMTVYNYEEYHYNAIESWNRGV